MIFLQETTNWNHPNHIYIIEGTSPKGTRCVGYIGYIPTSSNFMTKVMLKHKETSEPIVFTLDHSGRSFKQLTEDQVSDFMNTVKSD